MLAMVILFAIWGIYFVLLFKLMPWAISIT